MIHNCYITARYAETDAMGIIHHSVYPIWAEQARIELFNYSGISYHECEASGIMLPVTELVFRYKAPTYYGNKLCIKCAMTELTSRTSRIDYEIWHEDILCSIGYSKHMFMNSESRSSMKLDSEKLKRFEALIEPNFKRLA